MFSKAPESGSWGTGGYWTLRLVGGEENDHSQVLSRSPGTPSLLYALEDRIGCVAEEGFKRETLSCRDSKERPWKTESGCCNWQFSLGNPRIFSWFLRVAHAVPWAKTV